MASSINASTTAGVVTTADTSGVLNIQTAGTTAVSISAAQVVSFTNSPTVTGGTANGVAYLNGSKVLTTGSALVFDGTNLGVGVTPSAWTAYKVLQTNKGSFLSSGTNAFVGSNWYYDGTDKFITNDYATFYRQYTGAHSWHVSTISGASANDPITFTQAMTLSASGNLGIGITNPVGRLNVKSTYVSDTATQQRFEDSTGVSLNFGGTAGGKKFIQAQDTAGSATYYDVLINPLGGNLLVGTTSAAARFTVGGTAASAASSTICRIGDADYTTDTVLSVAPGVVNFDAAGVVGGRFHISSGGEVRIAGTTDQGAYNLQVQGTGVWGAGAYVNGSDSRIKEDIAPIATGLSVVEKLNPVTYRYKEDWSKDQSTQTGFIAQELLVALQDTNYVDSVVQQGGEKGYYSVAYQNIIPILTKAIQEQSALITQLQADVAALKGA